MSDSGCISPEDLDIFQLNDNVEEIVEDISRRFITQKYGPDSPDAK